MVGLYRLPAGPGGYPHWQTAAAYVVRISERVEGGGLGGAQVHTVLAQDPGPDDGVLELSLRRLSLTTGTPHTAGQGLSSSGVEKERTMSSGPDSKDGRSRMDEKKPQDDIGPRKRSFAAKFTAEVSHRRASKPSLSFEGYEAAARTATGEVYAWNLRWPSLPDALNSSADDCPVVVLPPMKAQLVALPRGERDSTLFPVSVSVRCAVCVTVGESEDNGRIGDRIKRAWKGKGRMRMMRFDGTTVN